jgi:hypothetical protein
MRRTQAFLRELGLPGADLGELPTSSKRFPDGAQYRVEIPSVEGPGAFAAVLVEAQARDVLVHRVSQGSGGLLLTDGELAEITNLGVQSNVEVSLFARPTAGWGTGAGVLAPTGASVGTQARGANGLTWAIEDICRIAEAGIRSVLITDLGVLHVANEMRKSGELPADLQFKISVQMGLANPASIRIAEQFGADTYNVPTDTSLAELAAIRAAIDIPIDFYVESPDDLGGFVRHYEIAEIVRVAAPVYLKFGLRNQPNIYPSGTHLENTVVALAKERVRRAEIGLAMLKRYGPDSVASKRGATGIAIPVKENQ